MPITKNAQKALRVSKRKNIVNSRVRSQVKTTLDKVKSEPTAENVASAYSAVDTAVKKNLMHRNKAARLKSQVASSVKSAAK